MSKFEVVIGEEIYTSSITDNILARFYIASEGICFPSEEWTDFVSPVLDTWTYSLIKFKDTSDKKLTIFFMDGPYKLHIYKEENKQLTIHCIDFSFREDIKLVITCDFHELMTAIYRAIKHFNYILYTCNMNEDIYKAIYMESIHSMRKIKKIIQEDKEA